METYLMSLVPLHHSNRITFLLDSDIYYAFLIGIVLHSLIDTEKQKPW